MSKLITGIRRFKHSLSIGLRSLMFLPLKGKIYSFLNVQLEKKKKKAKELINIYL